MEFFALDLETTGLDPKRDEILEIAWVRFAEGKPRERFQTLVRVTFLPKEVEELTGISAERLRRAPSLGEVLPEVLDRLSDKVVVAHNAPFDRAFLEEAARRLDIQLPLIYWVDTLSLSRLIWPERDSHALSALREKLRLAPQGAHRALPDAEATGYLFLEEVAAFQFLPEGTQELLLGWLPGPARELLREPPEPWGSANGQPLIEEIFELLERKLPSFHVRPTQVAYAFTVERALEEGGVYLLEAGPGTGKTYGYSVPLLLSLGKRRAVISTRTKALQDQLWHRDLPTLRETLRADVCLALLKGRENYICLRQLERERGLFSRELLQRVEGWLEETETFEVGELYPLLGGSPDGPALIERLRARPRRCAGRECAFFGECPSRRARRLAQEARIVVVNHSLLVADFVAGGALLGPYDFLVADEAHALPRAFQEGLTRTTSPGEVVRLLEEVETTLPPELVPRRELRAAWRELTRFRERLGGVLPEEPSSFCHRDGLRFLSLAQDLIWKLVDLRNALEDAADSVSGEERALAEGTATALEKAAGEMEFVLQAGDSRYVFWSERAPDPRFHATPLDFGEMLAEEFWGRFPGAVLTSATLSVRGRADFLLRELGVARAFHRVFPGKLSSPRAAAFLLEFLPHPDGDEFVEQLSWLLEELHERLGRKTLALFTSRRMLRAVEEQLRGVTVISQLSHGDAARAIELFRNAPAPALLLGLDTLWEGVDFPGEELEILVVARLPFPNPIDPVVRAKERRLREQGLDPFFELYLPQAVLKLAQGAGRLLRGPEDRGAVIIADRRIVAKPYGEAFRAKLSLPLRKASSFEELFFALEELFR
jgi:ATP-dependent DNA helicase DinG